MSAGAINRWTSDFLRAVRWPLAIMLIVSIAHSFSPGSLILGFVVLTLALGLFVWVLAILFGAISSACNRDWRGCGLNLLVAIGVWPSLMAVGQVGDYVHLASMYPDYASKISATSGKPEATITFDWGAFGFAGIGEGQRTLVYDPVGKFETENGSKRDLIGKFYVIDENY